MKLKEVRESLNLLKHGDEKKLAGKKHNSTWKILMTDYDLGETTSFLDHVYLGCTQRECQMGEDIVDICTSMFASRISAGAGPDAETICSWSYDMEGHAKKCVERCCEFAKKTTQRNAMLG